mmetsp:Transcript_18091/g.17455  ORF Transcript_18091/g.17455 Transcript_18091/m.17455 type:complete len:112 (-) Transcript_18091:69-404(-)
MINYLGEDRCGIPLSTNNDRVYYKKGTHIEYGEGDLCRLNVKYRNAEGRKAVLSSCVAVHYDFDAFNSTVNVTLPRQMVEHLKKNPNIECCDGDGVVAHCSIEGKLYDSNV